MARSKKIAPAHWNPAQRAAYELIHNNEHDGLFGAASFEEYLAKSTKVLTNEVNANNPDHKLGLETAIEAEIFANDIGILQAHAQMLKCVVVHLPAPESSPGNNELFTKFTEWQAKMGVTCQTIHKAFDPNGPKGSSISKKEAQEIAKAGHEHISRFMEFLKEVETRAE